MRNGSYIFSFLLFCYPVQDNRRRRIKTEEKAKIVAVIWGTELIQFIAVKAILHRDDLKKG